MIYGKANVTIIKEIKCFVKSFTTENGKNMLYSTQPFDLFIHQKIRFFDKVFGFAF